MAWTAALIDKAKVGETINCTVRFTSDKGEVVERVIPTNTADVSLPNFVARVIAELDKRDAAFAAVAPGPITPATLDNDTSPHIVFRRRMSKLLALKSLAPLKDATLTAAMDNLQSQVETYIKANPDAI